MRVQPMITCTSVSGSSEWYQRVLGFESAHGGDEYEMLMSGGQLVLQLHEIDADEHPGLLRPGQPINGNGAVIWFESDDYAGDLGRVRAAGDVDVLTDDHVNPLAQHREIWLSDPDDYVVVVSSPHGSV